MDRLQLTGRNQGRVFNPRSCRVRALQLHFSETKQHNLKLKTRPKQLLGSLPLVIVLPTATDLSYRRLHGKETKELISDSFFETLKQQKIQLKKTCFNLQGTPPKPP